jgi:hypothetical protein
VRCLLTWVNGRFATKALHNRGRLRTALADVFSRVAMRRLALLESGQWKPSMDTVDAVVSLTSWTPRLASLPLVLVGLLAQTRRPQTIFVWLTESDLALVSTKTRETFQTWGVRFRECPDFGPHKKWLPLIAGGMADPFVICDDDVFYPPGWLERLLREDRSDAYVGVRCHKIRFDETGEIQGYDSWSKSIDWVQQPSHDIFVTGVGGAIIHPRRITDEFRDWGKIREQCPQADDIWLKAAHVAAGIPCYRTRFTFPCLEVPESQQSALLNSNVDRGGNDKQMSPLQMALRRLRNKQAL